LPSAVFLSIPNSIVHGMLLPELPAAPLQAYFHRLPPEDRPFDVRFLRLARHPFPCYLAICRSTKRLPSPSEPFSASGCPSQLESHRSRDRLPISAVFFAPSLDGLCFLKILFTSARRVDLASAPSFGAVFLFSSHVDAESRFASSRGTWGLGPERLPSAAWITIEYDRPDRTQRVVVYSFRWPGEKPNGRSAQPWAGRAGGDLSLAA